MEKFNENLIIQRIKLVRNRYAGNRGKSKFARELGISASTYSYYENNRVPPIEVLLRICEVTEADLQWLLTGKEIEKKTTPEAQKSLSDSKTFAPETNKMPASELSGKFAPKSDYDIVGSSNASILRRLDKLLDENPELTEPILAFVDLLCEKKDIEQEFHSKISSAQIRPDEMFSPRQPRPGWIPVLGRTAAGMVHFWDQSFLPEPEQAVTELDELVKKHIAKAIIASTGGTVSIDLQLQALMEGLKSPGANLIQVGGQETNNIVEFVQCEQIHKLFPDSFALQVDGDSMSPRINDGDIVIVSPSVPAAQGQIGIARVANQIGVTCKLIRTTESGVHLIPINERYETKVVPKKDLLWALAVLCHLTV